MSYYPAESLSPKEALSETCPLCEGTGTIYLNGHKFCPRCDSTGRVTRTTHEPASGIGQERDELRVCETLLTGPLGSKIRFCGKSASKFVRGKWRCDVCAKRARKP